MQKQTYYDLFEVDFGASQDEIRQAYQRMRHVYKDNPEMMKQIKLGWAALRSRRSRDDYDKRISIAALRHSRQRIDRPPPTMVGDDFAIPQTEVGDIGGFGLPKTEVAPSPPKADAGKVEAPLPLPEQPVTLRIRPLEGEPWSRTLETGEYVIGRQQDGPDKCDICLPDPDNYISRRHATIHIRPEGCFIRDESSGNGTYVNGYPIPAGKPALLSPDDQVDIEGRMLTVDIEKESE